uniref:Uncharacterized protein n=1 Tax=Anopheles farauti TaxID=69004 RepID=A0A182QMI8_9DIPT
MRFGVGTRKTIRKRLNKRKILFSPVRIAARFGGQSGVWGNDGGGDWVIDLVELAGVDGRGSGVHRRVAADVGGLQRSSIGHRGNLVVLVGDGGRGRGSRNVGLGNRGSIGVGGRGSIHSRSGVDNRSGLDVGRLLDRRRHDGLLHGRGEHGLGDLLVVVLGEALVRVARRDGLLNRADVRHGRLLDDALLVGDLLLGDDGRRSYDRRVGERCRMHQMRAGRSSRSHGKNNGQHHQSEHVEPPPISALGGTRHAFSSTTTTTDDPGPASGSFLRGAIDICEMR